MSKPTSETALWRLLCAVKSGDETAISQILAERPDIPVTPSLMAAAAGGHAEAMRAILSKSRQSIEDGHVLSLAARSGHVECVQALLDVLPENAACISMCLIDAARDGQAACVKLLLPRNKKRSAVADALKWAAVLDQVDIIELLIAQAGASVGDGAAIECSAANGSVKSLRAMLPLWTRSAARSRWLQAAAYGGHAECLAILLDSFAPLPAPRMRELACFSRTGGHPQLTEAIESRIELILLAKHVAPTRPSARPRL